MPRGPLVALLPATPSTQREECVRAQASRGIAPAGGRWLERGKAGEGDSSNGVTSPLTSPAYEGPKGMLVPLTVMCRRLDV
eukprot:5791788-Prymnesium_polylepis.1